MVPDGRKSRDFRYLGMRAREVDCRQVRRTCPSRSTMGVPARPRVAIRGAGGLLCRLRSVLPTHPSEGAQWQLLVVGRHPGKVSHQPPAVRPRMIPKPRLRIHPWPRASRNGCERELLPTAAASFLFARQNKFYVVHYLLKVLYYCTNSNYQRWYLQYLERSVTNRR